LPAAYRMARARPAGRHAPPDRRMRSPCPLSPGKRCGTTGHVGAIRFIGVDLSWREGHADPVASETGVAVVDGDGQILDAGWTRGVEQTIGWADSAAGDGDAVLFADAPLVVRDVPGQRVGPGPPPRRPSARSPSAWPRRAAAPSPATRHPASGSGPAGALGRHGQSQAGEDLGLTASPATPSSSIARGPAHHSHDAANTSRRRGAARRATAPGRAARTRPGPPLRREGPGCHTPRGRLGRKR
jgi:hypothetical protein